MSSVLTKTAASDRDFQNALAALQIGKFEDAERLFEAVLRAQPKHVGALNLMGAVLMQRSRFAEAEAYFRRVLRQDARSEATLYNYGIVLKALNRPAEALEYFDKALQINPSVAETWNNRGTIFNDLDRYEEAIADFDKAIVLNPHYAEAFCNKGKALLALKLDGDALTAYDKALALKPDLPEAWLGCGNVLNVRERYDDAYAAYHRALALKPDLAEAWLSCGNVLFALARTGEASAAYDKALALKPDLAKAWLGCGAVFVKRKRYDEAFAAYDRVLKLVPDLAEAWLARGAVSFERRQYDEALVDYERALALKPDFAAALLAIGTVFLERRRYDEALAAFDKAEALDPRFAEVWLCRGNVFLALKRFDDALVAYAKALELKAGLAESWTGRGAVLIGLEQFDDALEAFDRAMDIKSDLPEAWFGRGNALYNLSQYEEALTALDRALELKPNFAQAWLTRGLAAQALMKHDQAFLSYHQALTLEPDLDYVEGYRLLTKLYLCDWTELEVETAQLLSRLRAGATLSTPFTLLPIPSTAADQLQCAQHYVKDLPVFPRVWLGERYSHDRIRVAYLSADFRDHAVAHLAAGLFENHNKSRFEITAISIGSAQDSAIRRRLENAFEHFVDVGGKTDEEIADLIRNYEVDIAVDLMGHTQHSRLGILGRRPAPIQVHYLGYAGTLGTNYIDYVLADSMVVPEEQRAFYTEQVVWLPDSYLANDNKRAISRDTPTRQECGLPEGGFVFCSFNNAYKISPKMFPLWMRLLRAVPNSVIWLSQASAIAMNNLDREAERYGVSRERLIFAAKVENISDHLARQRQADLFLDTLPYNAHTTASDALWAGLPVLTCLGETFAGRVAASLLKAVGLPELITTSLEDYEALALKLAREPTLLAAIKAKLANNRDTCPLFDTARFTRHIEAAYTTMWERQQRGEPPECFAVKPIDLEHVESNPKSLARR
jgi:predicted O-linked N-acetylglucosamine transferase (SPINDLY family)